MSLAEALKIEQHVYSVTEITREIRVVLEESLPIVWVMGEISNFRLHTSGHMYFSLKDESAQIPCVMWRERNRSLYFTPQDGMKVLAQGGVTVYEKRGYYQLEVFQLQPAGVGELQLAFERLKQRLRAEGLFDEARKKPLPLYPERIGIVTSPDGAAIRDLVSILRRRFPPVEIILNPVRVQGDGAAEEIARAIDEFNAYGEVDLLIVGRGGGSLEDLWAFNEEVVARAISRSTLPVISAVGHEVDFSISDFVADLRAPTPSAAAELAVRSREEILAEIRGQATKMYRLLANRLEFYRARLERLERSYGFRRPEDALKQLSQRLDEMTRFLETTFTHRLQRARGQVESLTKRLNSLSPFAILERGYSICYRASDQKIVKRAVDVAPKEAIEVQLHQGRLFGAVERVED